MPLFESISLDIAMRFLVATGVGGLIGLERERHHGEKTVVAGVRTMPITAISGVMVVLLAERTSPSIYGAAFLVYGAIAALMLWLRQRSSDPGLTTPVTFLAVFLIGILAGLGEFFVAVIVGVGITFLLFYKDYLHRFADVLKEDELRGALYFLVVAFILYPLAPSDAIDPWGMIHPQQVILIVVLVSSLSFAGFLVMRRYGTKRGLPLTGLLGGLVSSVAAAGAIAGMALESQGLKRAGAQGIMLATTSMLIRNMAILVIVDATLTLAGLLAVPLLGMALLLVIGVVVRGTTPADESLPDGESLISVIRSPFALRPALQFGLIFVGLSVAAFALQRIPGLGEYGIFLTALGGLVSSGAVLVSMALLAVSGTVEAPTAASVGLVSVVISVAVKFGIAYKAGSGVAKYTSFPLMLAMVAGLFAAVALIV